MLKYFQRESTPCFSKSSLTDGSLQLSSTHANAKSHFAIGDIAALDGIKRVGNALIMGQIAATNIVSMMIGVATNADGPNKNSLTICPPFNPMMALTIGNNVLGYQLAAGVQWGGEELKNRIVGRGLGIDGEFVAPQDNHAVQK